MDFLHGIRRGEKREVGVVEADTHLLAFTNDKPLSLFYASVNDGYIWMVV